MVTGGLTQKNVVMLLFSLWYLQFPQMPASCLSASCNTLSIYELGNYFEMT